MNSPYAMFLMTGAAHLPYLTVALNTLRRVYSGTIRVYAYPESYEIAKEICEDPRVCAKSILYTPEYAKKNSQEINKIKILRDADSDRPVVYLDADLIFNRSIDELFEAAEYSTFAAVQFCDWTMSGRTHNRVERLYNFDSIPMNVVTEALNKTRPALNSGVFASREGHPALKTWYEWTYAARSIFIAGETALHAVVVEHRSKVILGGAYNCSPKFKPEALANQDVAIWHGHGDCFVRNQKSPLGVDLWWPQFEIVMRDNIGGIRRWIDRIDHPDLCALRGKESA